MPDITISVTAQQAQRITEALDDAYPGPETPIWKLKRALRRLVLEYERGRQAFLDAEQRDLTFGNEEDWGA